MDTLLNLSGGLDSVYCMYDYLRNNSDKILLTHHIVMPHSRNTRWKKEKKSVEKVLVWMRQQGYRNFRYRESVFDVGDIRKRPLDSSIVSFYTGIILRDPRYWRISNIIVPTPKDEYERLGDELIERQQIARSIRELIIDRPIIPIYPIKDMSKKEIIAATPDELLELTWSCRQPRGGQPCRRYCHTCRQMFE